MATYISKIGDWWYAYEWNLEKNEVYSIGDDNPKEGGRWYARFSDVGIKYVAMPLATRSGAYKKARRCGEYGGVIKV